MFCVAIDIVTPASMDFGGTNLIHGALLIHKRYGVENTSCNTRAYVVSKEDSSGVLIHRSMNLRTDGYKASSFETSMRTKEILP